MAKSAKPQLPAKATDIKTGLDRIRNDVINWLDKLGAGRTPHSMDSGQKVVRILSSSLWYVEHQRDKFKSQVARLELITLVLNNAAP